MSSETYRRGVVTSPHYLASQSGQKILEAGGNAVEAAVAAAATLSVVYPHMTGLGGDSFWLIQDPDKNTFAIDACGAAGQHVSSEIFTGESIPQRGPLAAITMAGTVSGWRLALEQAEERTGPALPLETVLSDAITHAECGVSVTESGARVAASKDSDLRDLAGYSEVFRRQARPLEAGEILYQPALAKTLRRLAQNGLCDFYSGELADDLAADLEMVGSPLRAVDFAEHSAQLTTPLTARALDAELINLGPPTQGLASLMILSVFDRMNVEREDGFEHIHSLVEATKLAFSYYKSIDLGDPQYMSVDPQAVLDDQAGLMALAAQIHPQTARPWPYPSQTGDTTWFGAMDMAGWCVSAIQSTYFEFGSGLVLPRTGVTWQNRGASFTLNDSGWNALKPGRKPFHTLNPAMARFDDGRTMVYGCMGGDGQPQTQAAIFSRYARFGADLAQSIAAPRWLLGRTWGDTSTTLKLEDGFDPDLYEALEAAGHAVERVPACNEIMGHAGALVRTADGDMSGASDPRSDGEVAGW